MKPTLADIQTVIRLQLGLKKIEAEDHLVEQLGAVSADIVNIIVAIEEKYDIEVEESALGDIATVADLFHLVEQLA